VTIPLIIAIVILTVLVLVVAICRLCDDTDGIMLITLGLIIIGVIGFKLGLAHATATRIVFEQPTTQPSLVKGAEDAK
jgi:predicted tellurium resistance membrane protein TerC